MSNPTLASPLPTEPPGSVLASRLRLALTGVREEMQTQRDWELAQTQSILDDIPTLILAAVRAGELSAVVTPAWSLKRAPAWVALIVDALHAAGLTFDKEDDHENGSSVFVVRWTQLTGPDV